MDLGGEVVGRPNLLAREHRERVLGWSARYWIGCTFAVGLVLA
jgi:hypothetical protein